MGDEYYLQPPKHQLFYRFVANMMSFYSVGNRMHWGYEKCNKVQVINSMIILIFAPIVAFSQMIYLYMNYSYLTLDVLGIIFSVLPVCCLATVNICSSRFKSYKRISKNFLQNIHLYNIYKETKSEFVKKKLLALEQITRWTSYYLFFFFLTNWCGWVSITASNNYKNKEFVLNHTMRLQTSLYMWMPFDYSYNFHNWIILHAINSYCVLTGVSAMMMFQSVNYMFIYNVIGHIHVLKNSLRTDFTDNLSDDEVRTRLSKIIKYNNFIINVFKDVQLAFKYNVTANYMENLFGNSMVMYQLKYGGKENMMLYVVMIMTYTFGPIVMSLVLEEIRRQSDKLPDIVYSIPWENMSVSNQKIVMLMLQRSQILMDFQAVGGMKAGIGPMLSILKTTFSYYVMLESSIENKN